MKEVKVRELTLESFAPYGTFANLIDPPDALASGRPVAFIPDMAQLNLGRATIASFSVCRVQKRPNVVDTVEYHTSCGEGILPLDQDVLIHVGKPSFKGVVPMDGLEVFRVPKGTFVSLRRGVWHFAPYALTGEAANVLIVLPERTYFEDCEVVEMPEEKRFMAKL